MLITLRTQELAKPRTELGLRERIDARSLNRVRTVGFVSISQGTRPMYTNTVTQVSVEKWLVSLTDYTRRGRSTPVLFRIRIAFFLAIACVSGLLPPAMAAMAAILHLHSSPSPFLLQHSSSHLSQCRPPPSSLSQPLVRASRGGCAANLAITTRASGVRHLRGLCVSQHVGGGR